MRLGNLTTLENVQKLRTALHAKAKEEPEYRFYALYGLVKKQTLHSGDDFLISLLVMGEMV